MLDLDTLNLGVDHFSDAKLWADLAIKEAKDGDVRAAIEFAMNASASCTNILNSNPDEKLRNDIAGLQIGLQIDLSKIILNRNC